MSEEKRFRFWSRYARSYLYEPRKKASGSVLLLIAILILLFAFGYYPTFNQISAKREVLKMQETTLKDAQSKIKYINTLKPAYEKTKANLDRLEKLMPSEDKVPDFLEYISIVASKHGYQVTFFSPSKATEKAQNSGMLTENLITINLEGNLQNVLPLIKEIESGERFVGVRYVNMGGGERGGGVIKMDLVVYSFKEGLQ